MVSNILALTSFLLPALAVATPLKSRQIIDLCTPRPPNGSDILLGGDVRIQHGQEKSLYWGVEFPFSDTSGPFDKVNLVDEGYSLNTWQIKKAEGNSSTAFSIVSTIHDTDTGPWCASADLDRDVTGTDCDGSPQTIVDIICICPDPGDSSPDAKKWNGCSFRMTPTNSEGLPECIAWGDDKGSVVTAGDPSPGPYTCGKVANIVPA